jgi:hypothetical protein
MTSKQFNLNEALRNSKGKSSLGLLFGFIYGLTAIVLYAIGIICVFTNLNCHIEIFTQAAILTGASSTLLGVRRFTKDKEYTDNDISYRNTAQL